MILAGGRGERLGGCDKSALRWQGRTFLDHLIARLVPQAATIVISAPARADHFPADLRWLPDPWPDARGPLAGVLAAMEACTTRWLLVATCDAPRSPTDLAARLFDALSGDDGARAAPRVAYATCGEARHFLHALIDTTLARSLRGYLERDGLERNGLERDGLERERRKGDGRSVFGWYQQVGAIAVPFADAAAFANINTPEDLAALRASVKMP